MFCQSLIFFDIVILEFICFPWLTLITIIDLKLLSQLST